jgi:hypothetical protein
MQHGPFDFLDLKIRVPPHITSKFNQQQHQQPQQHAAAPTGPSTATIFYPSTALQPFSASSGQPSVFGAHATLFTCAASQPPPVASTTVAAEPSGGSPTGPPPLCLFWLPMLRALTIVATGFCLAPLFWVVSFHAENNRPELLEARAQQGACFFLLTAPLTQPTLVCFQACHARGRWITFVMACGSLLMGNTSAVLYCTGSPHYQRLRVWLLSGSMITAVLQKLLLVHKGNVILLMLSTASAVIVCCLALVAPFLPSLAMTYRCFESMAIPMVWLWWQAVWTPSPPAQHNPHHGHEV